MIKYVMMAAALKFFSLTPQTKQLYRQLGNTPGQRRRIKHGLVDAGYPNLSRQDLECIPLKVVHQKPNAFGSPV